MFEPFPRYGLVPAEIKDMVGPVIEGKVNNLSGVLQWQITDPVRNAVDRYVKWGGRGWAVTDGPAAH